VRAAARPDWPKNRFSRFILAITLEIGDHSIRGGRTEASRLWARGALVQQCCFCRRADNIGWQGLGTASQTRLSHRVETASASQP